MNFYHLLNQVFQKRIVKTIFGPIMEIRNLELAKLLMSWIAWISKKYCEVLFFLIFTLNTFFDMCSGCNTVIRILTAFKSRHISCYPTLHRVLGSCWFQRCGFHLCAFSKNSPNIQLIPSLMNFWLLMT